MTTNPTGDLALKADESQNAPCFGETPKTADLGDTHDGTLTGVFHDTLVISTTDNQQMSFRVGKDAYVCCDGVVCGVENLKLGSKIRLTAHATDKNVATIIESLNNQVDFADHH